MFDFAAMVAIIFIVAFDFGPKGGGVVHMVKMGKFVQNYVIAQGLRYFHEANIKRNRATRRAATPACVGMRESAAVVFVAV